MTTPSLTVFTKSGQLDIIQFEHESGTKFVMCELPDGQTAWVHADHVLSIEPYVEHQGEP